MKEAKQIAHEYLSSIAKARWADANTRAKAAASHRARWSDPEKRERYLEAQRKRREREAREKQS